ncbi:Type II secretion system protein G precursor [compost metagenome]
MAAPSDETRWSGPYLQKKVPQDPWGRNYIYRQPGENGEYDLLSMGKDGQPGGEGENAEITSWQ